MKEKVIKLGEGSRRVWGLVNQGWHSQRGGAPRQTWSQEGTQEEGQVIVILGSGDSMGMGSQSEGTEGSGVPWE